MNRGVVACSARPEHPEGLVVCGLLCWSASAEARARLVLSGFWSELFLPRLDDRVLGPFAGEAPFPRVLRLGAAQPQGDAQQLEENQEEVGLVQCRGLQRPGCGRHRLKEQCALLSYPPSLRSLSSLD